MIPIDQVTVRGSNPRVLAFPATALLVSLALRPGALHVEVLPASPWPAVPVSPGETGTQAATLWVFLQIAGAWHATGAERLRPGQIAGEDKPEDGDCNQFIAVNWLFDVTRWGPMAGYVPQVGELVGMMVAAGSTRSDDATPVEERTPVVAFAWPGPGGGEIRPVWVEGQDDDVDPGHDLPDPGWAAIFDRLAAMDQAVAGLAGEIGTLRAALQRLWADLGGRERA